MTNYLLKGLCACFIVSACNEKLPQKSIDVTYPKTKKEPVVDDYFGEKVTDNYRWLEDDRSKDTEAWVKAENKVTFTYLDKIPFREALKDRLSELWNYEKIGSPFKEGAYTYYFKNIGLQNHNVLYRTKGGSTEEVFLNPNTFSEDGTTSLGEVSFSKDGKTVAYSISEGGSDWRKIIIMDAASKTIKEDTLIDVKFSGISWKGNEGFYYSSYDKPEGSELSAKTDQHKLYYHELGTPQKDDSIIFGALKEQKHRYVSGYVTEDDHYLVISASTSTSGNKLFIKDLTKVDSELVTVLNTFESDTHVIDNRDDILYLVTNLKAPNKKIVTVSANQPEPKYWKDFIPETKNVLNPSTGAGYIFAEYMVDAVSKIYQYDFDGKLKREVNLPGIGSVSGFVGKTSAKELYFSFTNYNTPSSSYKFNPNKGTYELYWKPEISFHSDAYESQQVFYTSKDGTKVPMIITYKKGLELQI